MNELKAYKIREMDHEKALNLIEKHEAWVPVDVANDLFEALEQMFRRYAPAYHDCTDDGLPECELCVAEKALANARGEQ